MNAAEIDPRVLSRLTVLGRRLRILQSGRIPPVGPMHRKVRAVLVDGRRYESVSKAAHACGVPQPELSILLKHGARRCNGHRIGWAAFEELTPATGRSE